MAHEFKPQDWMPKKEEMGPPLEERVAESEVVAALVPRDSRSSTGARSTHRSILSSRRRNPDTAPATALISNQGDQLTGSDDD